MQDLYYGAKQRVALFSGNSIEVIENVLDISFNKYETPKISKTLFLTALKVIKKLPIITTVSNDNKQFFKLIIYSFVVTLIDPKKIITALFYNSDFQKLAIIFPGIEFFAVSVGYGHYELEEKIFGIKFSDFDLTNVVLLLQGKFQYDKMVSKGAKIGEYHVIGSLNNELYSKSRKIIQKKYDICFISNFKDGYGTSRVNFDVYGIFSEIFYKLGYSICVAGRYPYDRVEAMRREKQYFEQAFKFGVDYYPRNAFSTYELSDNSLYTIGDNTTSLIEAYARGCVTIGINPSARANLDPIVCHHKLKDFDFSSVFNTIKELEKQGTTKPDCYYMRSGLDGNAIVLFNQIIFHGICDES